MNIKTSLSPAQVNRRHQIEIIIGVLVYTAVLITSVRLLKYIHTEPWRILLALAPVVPTVFIVWSVFRQITRLDELQRRIQTEALAIAAGGTALLGLTYTFLEGDAGFPHSSAWWAWVSVGVIWLLARTILTRRYR